MDGNPAFTVHATVHAFRAAAKLKSRCGARHFHLRGPLEGPVLQQGKLSMVCVGISERDLKIFGGSLVGPGKSLGEQWPPLAPPSSAPA